MMAALARWLERRWGSPPFQPQEALFYPMVRMSYSGGGIMTPSQDSEATPSCTKDRGGVALSARGDVRAFARLCVAASARIFHLALRLPSCDSAVDIAQASFLR